MMSGAVTDMHCPHNIDVQKAMGSFYNETLTAKNVMFEFSAPTSCTDFATILFL